MNRFCMLSVRFMTNHLSFMFWYQKGVNEFEWVWWKATKVVRDWSMWLMRRGWKELGLLIQEKKGCWGNLTAAFQSNLLFNVRLITNTKQLGVWVWLFFCFSCGGFFFSSRNICGGSISYLSQVVLQKYLWQFLHRNMSLRLLSS